MKIEKTSGLSRVALEMFQSGGAECLKSLTGIFDILFQDKLQEEWMLNSLILIFKGKGIPLIQTLIGE